MAYTKAKPMVKKTTKPKKVAIGGKLKPKKTTKKKAYS